MRILGRPVLRELQGSTVSRCARGSRRASVAYQDYLSQELSEARSLTLQAALDRTSKFLDVLSNIMKKISDTSDQLVQNAK
jgi:hypothetical protein